MKKKMVVLVILLALLGACGDDEELYEGPTGDEVSLRVRDLYLPFEGGLVHCLWVTNHEGWQSSESGLWCDR